MATPEQAEAVLNSPAFDQAFTSVRADLFEELTSGPVDSARLVQARQKLDALNLVRYELEARLNDIKNAERQ